ncbi:MAG TPA: type IV pilus assembly protein PilM [Patescibacteria group bacterium]
MKQKAFGLDIGTSSIKAVWLSRESKGFLLQSAQMLPAPLKGMVSESPLDQEEMAKSIRAITTESKISTRYVNIALPENQVYTRVVEMPPLSDKELSSAIYWEAEQYIPVPLDTITLDYKVLKRPEGNGLEKMQVLLVGAPTAIIDKYEHVLNLAGLSINVVETELLSMVRSLVVEDKFPASLIVSIGAVSTSLAIIHDNMLVFTYSLPTGGVALSRAIASDFGFAIQQAEEYKKVYGLVDKTIGGKIGKVTEPILFSILTEMKKALVFYGSKYPNDPIKQIILSGGSAKLPGLATYFTSNTGVETATANPWKILAAQEVPKDIIENAAEYTIAVGLAMRD